ncbi:AMP-binding protein [Pseudogemmobacter humi]|uniref:Putative acyl--CoA ligase YhfT n=1 Tax=Pseudogemmobacter humi TaxID=2483812 RepID=A0A3P5XCD1_9RHOB|nr:AMP-binding protein [Pseudogemmobacter humi]VDC32321.1 putative acyl--CoA ligase YhfT [Pseudogemmobacter humi]
MSATGFRWHPAARLYRPDGAGELPEEQIAAAGIAGAVSPGARLPGTAKSGLAAADTAFPEIRPCGNVIPDVPAARALACALASGGGFAIRAGADGPAPAPGEVPVFETLTSGSGGVPRRIRRSQASWIRSFTVNAGLFGLGPGRRVAVPGRLVHSLSLYGALEGLHLGCEVHVLAGLRPDRQHRALAARGIDTLYATPAQLRALCGYGALADLRLVLCGGSKLDAKLRADLAQMAPGAAIREFYGAAEASFITLADEETPAASVGRPYPGVEILVDEGEIWVKSPYLFEGYAGGGEGGACWRDGWLSVGEMGRFEGGFLYLSGRRGRMVSVADQNVFPEEIEAMIEAMPGVSRAAVLAEPDARRGHVLFAVVRGEPAREGEILAALRARLGPMKAPRWLVWRQDWPELASGKTDFAALRARL